MKLKKTILSLIFIGVFNLSFAQVIDGFVGNVGLGYRFIYNNNYKYKDEFRLSGNLGVFKEIKIAKRPILRFELLIFQFNNAFFVPDPRISKVKSQRVIRQHTFLSFITLYKFKPKKFGFHIGPQTNLLLLGKTIIHEHMVDGTNSESTGSGFNFLLQNKIPTEFGIKLGLDLSVNKRISMTLDYYGSVLWIESFNSELDLYTSFINLGIIYSIKEIKNGL